MSSRAGRVRGLLKDGLRPVVTSLGPRREDLPSRLWGLERLADGHLAANGVRLTDILAEHGSPLFLADLARLDANARAFLSVPAGAVAGVECYYSYKTNPVPAVLSRLHAGGIGAEVISEYELWLARHLGVPGDRIVANGPGRSESMLRTAIEIGALVQINHREEVAVVADLARSVGKPCRVGLRVVPAQGWGGQFGEPIATALDIYRDLARRPELDVVAVHSHMGGELSKADAVRAMVREVLDFSFRLRAELGVGLGILDFGGSLACPTTRKYSEAALRLNRAFGTDLLPRPPEEVLGIEEYVRTIVTEVEDRFRRENRERPRLFVEPGRAMTGNTQMLLCKVTALKASGARPGLPHAVLNAGINIAGSMRGEYHQIFCAGPERRGDSEYRLVGPICTPEDSLAWSWRLPPLEIGDVLAIMDAGAYMVPFSTSFSFPQPGIAVLDGPDVRVVRRAETFEDLVRRDAPTS